MTEKATSCSISLSLHLLLLLEIEWSPGFGVAVSADLSEITRADLLLRFVANVPNILEQMEREIRSSRIHRRVGIDRADSLLEPR
jgi:hypothetical protein